MRQTEALASVIFFVYHPQYLGRELNHGHCLSHKFFLATAQQPNLTLTLTLTLS